MVVESKKRKYELRRRAEAMEDTRRRITEAAVDLHGSVGPARTTISAVAERAGVQRHTVYRYFPTEDALFAACSSHYAQTHPEPDSDAWKDVADPRERLATGLNELYRWYEETEPMMSRVLRDAHLVDAVQPPIVLFLAYLDDAAGILAAGWPAKGARRRVVAAAVRHVVDFTTWRSLVHDSGISRAQGVRLAGAMVEAAVGSKG
jgi:AcrR family transcriptional regulator